MKLLTICIISNYSKRFVFWTPCRTNLVIILICGIAFSSVFKLCTIVPFVDYTLDKCRTVLFILKAKNLKYKQVVLPENVSNKKLDILLNAIRNLLHWEEMHRRKMTMLNQNQYIQDQKVLWQVVHHQQV